MRTASWYLDQADECERIARQLSLDEARRDMMRMADDWRAMSRGNCAPETETQPATVISA